MSPFDNDIDSRVTGRRGQRKNLSQPRDVVTLGSGRDLGGAKKDKTAQVVVQLAEQLNA